uniref:Uncharacterized protein n=1 Tax=Acrobeloides nanus TaxID=290746 RepID=A0A914D403_9BILA
MKRLIGNQNALECIKRNGKYWTFKVNENSEVEVNLDNQTKRIKPEEVSAQILIKLKQSAENVVRKQIKNIVLTVPAYFDENQKKATTKAAELAGLNVLEMISEPSAAAYAYGFDQQKFPDTNLLVFDLGGGTLDVVIVKIKDVKNNNIDMVRLLLENGENPNAIDTNDQIALHLAASDRSDKTEFVELLLKHQADIELKDKYGRTSLMIAASSQNINIVLYLLGQGADPNRKDKIDKTALHYAASNLYDNTLFAELLLKHGADIEIQDKDGWTSLMEAVLYKRISIVRYLLEQGSDPNRKDNRDKTALHHAALNLKDNKLIVELLLKHGADINIQDKDGWTSLMRAVSINNINIVRYLLEQDADPDKINANGNTALHIVRSTYNYPNKEIIDLLSKYVKK